MSESREKAPVHHLLRLLAERLESWLEGDELAFESLVESLEEAGFTAEDVHGAVGVLRHLADGPPEGETALEAAPGDDVLRVLSAEERVSLSPEAWGALLALRRDGSLNAAQFERVLGVLGGIGVRPVDADLALEVAGRVALDADDEGTESVHGEIDLPH
jgi:uncharacterized protein Smg (DUF494 family)